MRRSIGSGEFGSVLTAINVPPIISPSSERPNTPWLLIIATPSSLSPRPPCLDRDPYRIPLPGSGGRRGRLVVGRGLHKGTAPAIGEPGLRVVAGVSRIVATPHNVQDDRFPASASR